MVDGVPIPNLELGTKAVSEIFQRQLGANYRIRAAPEQKTYDYYEPGEGNAMDKCYAKTGRIRVQCEKMVREEEDKFPVEGKFKCRIPGIPCDVILTTELISGNIKRCKFCKGKDCTRDRCNKRCRFCFTTLEDGHMESDCEANFSDAKLAEKTKRVAYKIQEMVMYKEATVFDFTQAQLEDEKVRETFRKEQEDSYAARANTYSSVIRKSANEAKFVADLNKKESSFSDQMYKAKINKLNAARRTADKFKNKNAGKIDAQQQYLNDPAFIKEAKELRAAQKEEFTRPLGTGSSFIQNTQSSTEKGVNPTQKLETPSGAGNISAPQKKKERKDNKKKGKNSSQKVSEEKNSADAGNVPPQPENKEVAEAGIKPSQPKPSAGAGTIPTREDRHLRSSSETRNKKPVAHQQRQNTSNNKTVAPLQHFKAPAAPKPARKRREKLSERQRSSSLEVPTPKVSKVEDKTIDWNDSEWEDVFDFKSHLSESSDEHDQNEQTNLEDQEIMQTDEPPDKEIGYGNMLGEDISNIKKVEHENV